MRQETPCDENGSCAGVPRQHIHGSTSGALEFDLTQLDSELEAPLPPETLLALTREPESDTESERAVPRRRLVLQFARDEQGNNGSGDEHQRSHAVEEEPNEDLLFTSQTRAMSNGFEGLDEVSSCALRS